MPAKKSAAERPKIAARDIGNLKKIIAALKANAGGLWVREIARQSGLHLDVVRRLLVTYPFLFEEYADFTQYGVRLKIIKLRRGVAEVEDLARYIEFAKKVK